MNQLRFDDITRRFSHLPSRRRLLGGLASGILGLGAAQLPDLAAKKKKRKGKKRKGRKAKPNAFGCLDVGDPCKSEEQCCSGICEGKKGKRKCVAHDAGVCGADSDICISGQPSFCGGANPNCICLSTTGNAGFCGEFAPGVPGAEFCRDCSQDSDCEEDFGPGAACVVYGGICESFCAVTGGTACVPACNDTIG
jgi:hypothetical protein